jgi:hypothetical protein
MSYTTSSSSPSSSPSSSSTSSSSSSSTSTTTPSSSSSSTTTPSSSSSSSSTSTTTPSSSSSSSSTSTISYPPTAETIDLVSRSLRTPDPSVYQPEIILNHSMKGGGKTWTFQIGGAGCNKGVTRIPVKFSYRDIDIYGFGQDSLGILKQPNQLILTLADGHGPSIEGKDMSYKVHSFMSYYMCEYRNNLLTLLRDGDHKSIEKIVCDTFKSVDEILMKHDEITSKHQAGGTTFTMIHKILDEDDGSLYTLSYNVGDSPYFKINIGKEGRDTTIEAVSQEQNCDNIECVEQYHNLCMADGETPSPIILGRFNIPNRIKAPWMGTKTIKPFNIDLIDGNYKFSANESVMKKFYEEAPDNIKNYALYNGGPQSIRGQAHNLAEIQEGRFPATNFGNTVGGDLQMPFSFGDKKSKLKHNIKCIPHIAILKETTGSIDFVSSDGAVDCLTDDNIRELFEQYNTISPYEFMEVIKTRIDANATKGAFGFSHFTKIPTWDDLSYWIVETKVTEDLEFKVKKLEEEHVRMTTLANRIRHELGLINTLISALSE